MKMTKKAFFVLVIILIFSSCFSDWKGDKATLTISFGGGSGRAAAWPPTESGILGEIEYTVILSSGSTKLEPIKKNGTETITTEIDPGQWDVHIDAYIGEILFAEGSDRANVIAGRNNEVEVRMTGSEDYTFFAVESADEWNDIMGEISKVWDKKYVFIVTKNFTTTKQLNLSVPDITICGSHKVEWGGVYQNLLVIGEIVGGNVDQTVTMRDLQLVGRKENTSALVLVDKGTFIMEGSASITGNTYNSGNGGGVVVHSGTFNMNGSAVISGNTATGEGGGDGGGVYVINGTFNMSGSAVISGNKAIGTGNEGSGNGGGVYVHSGEFNMSGSAVISGNTVTGTGGGVYNTSTFNMIGGTISGNEAEGGGGVYVDKNVDGIDSIFTMSGGTIGGDEANTAASGGGVTVSDGTFNMSGSAVISGNKVIGSPSYGGGVYLYGDATFNMSGGIITGNFVTENKVNNYGAGVCHESSGAFRVGGTANIRGNKKPDSNGDNSNVYLASGKLIVLGYRETDNELPPPDGMMICVTTASPDGIIVEVAEEEDEDYFGADNGGSVSFDGSLWPFTYLMIIP